MRDAKENREKKKWPREILGARSTRKGKGKLLGLGGSPLFRSFRVLLAFGTILENYRKSSELRKVVGNLRKIVKTSPLVCLCNKQNITCPLVNMNFIFDIYRVEHLNIKFISTRGHVISSIYPALKNCIVIILKSDLLLLYSKKKRLIYSKIAIFCN